MQDTPDYIYKKQHEIFMQKPAKERFLLNLELTEFVREMTKRRIIKQYPNISKAELQCEMFKQSYSDLFSPKEMGKILLAIKTYHSNKT